MAARAKAVASEGLLTRTSSACRGVNGFHRPLPSFEQIGSYKTVTRFPYGSSFHQGTSQPKISSLGSRGLHASRVLSESTKVSNRPLSPHLPLKKPQLSATYSISHRIFGASVASLILLVPVAMKFSLMYDV
ncbi:succinate dehydrogenase subunit 3-2, mitochondrial [Cocos nucifera]|uniref:Succinate dehydrogenase subunit 3-2, mitochondrial n=1 Tax=Cocos nucifera TaxID=13894 RepID=A0A8K0IV58_COCNU|nr:succinate dehydrogenase subunit 3-2, mitochondrial [Cocos nucifera]